MASIRIDPKQEQALTEVRNLIHQISTINSFIALPLSSHIEIRIENDKKTAVSYELRDRVQSELIKALRKENQQLSKTCLKLAKSFSIDLDDTDKELLYPNIKEEI